MHESSPTRCFSMPEREGGYSFDMLTNLPNPRARLLHKYGTLSLLKLTRATAESEGRDEWSLQEARGRRQQFRMLSLEFPGSLRELEQCTLRAFEDKNRVLTSIGAIDPLPLWASVTWEFHLQLRDALSAKGWLAKHLPRGGEITDEMYEAFFRWWPGRLFPVADVPPPSRAELLRHLRPPEGRLQALIWEKLSRRFERPSSFLESLVFSETPWVSYA